MKNKVLFNLIFSIVAAITTLTISIAASFSWFEGVREISEEFEIKADGVLYLYIPASMVETDEILTPAKAMPGAVANGLNMDVLNLYNETDEEPSYVSQTAEIAEYSTDFVFYNEFYKKVQATDEEGNLLYDEEGEPIYVQATDEEGNLLYDENGDPIYEKEPYPANISYNIGVKDQPYEDGGNYLDIEEITIKEFYFSYDSEPIEDGEPINEENGAIAYTEVEEDKTSGTVRIEGTREIFMHMQLHLSNVDELMDPVFREKNIYLEIELLVELDGLTPPEEA